MGIITIFEGPDGAGKTTAAKKYAAATEGIYCHFAAMLNTESIFDVYSSFLKAVIVSDIHFILDRAWFSEFAYGPVMRNRVRLSDKEEADLGALACLLQPVMVMCLPSFEEICRNWQSRLSAEYVKDESAIAEIYNRYVRLTTTHKVRMPIAYYDYTLQPDVFSALQSLDCFRGVVRCPTS